MSDPVAVSVAVKSVRVMAVDSSNPARLGAPRGNRTPNPLIKSQLLCQLS